MTTKKTYRRPNTTVVLLAAESSLMTISAATSDPTEGGDPTGSNNRVPTHSRLLAQPKYRHGVSKNKRLREN